MRGQVLRRFNNGTVNGIVVPVQSSRMVQTKQGERSERDLYLRDAAEYARYARTLPSGRRLLALQDIEQERTRKIGTPIPMKLHVPLSRLIATSDTLETVARKVTLDVNQGRDLVPLLYGPIYDNLTDENLPRNVDTNLIAQAAVVFLRRFEGGEVKFGHMTTGTNSTVPIVNYSAGFEYTEEVVMFDETWSMERLNRAFGEAYNALLNHIHLDAVNSFSYPGGNLTPADATGATLLLQTRNTIINGLRTASNARRPATVMLASGADRYQIQDALERRADTDGNVLPGISEIDTIIFYDGYSITVGEKTYTYPGIASKTAYLIMPRSKMLELVRTVNGQDMFTVIGNPDVSRRIAEQITAHTYRGLFADVAGSVQKITLPT